jgi:hypothetical protein
MKLKVLSKQGSQEWLDISSIKEEMITWRFAMRRSDREITEFSTLVKIMDL